MKKKKKDMEENFKKERKNHLGIVLMIYSLCFPPKYYIFLFVHPRPSPSSSLSIRFTILFRVALSPALKAGKGAGAFKARFYLRTPPLDVRS